MYTLTELFVVIRFLRFQNEDNKNDKDKQSVNL